MKILIISATDMEVAPFRAAWEADAKSGANRLEISFITTGIGMLATASRLSAALSENRFQLVIQAGIAGCFDNNSALGAVYRVSADRIADLGVEEDHVWKDVFDMGLVGPDDAPFTAAALPAPAPEQFPALKIRGVTAITVNEITTRMERIEQLKTKYNPVLESMEGAALHFTAAEYGLPFVQIRAVSNYIGERNKANWRIKEAIINLNDELGAWLNIIADSL